MSKLPVYSRAEAVRAFERLDYRRVSQRGSRVRMKHEGREPLTIPLHKTLAKGTLRGIVRASGFSPDEFAGAL